MAWIKLYSPVFDDKVVVVAWNDPNHILCTGNVSSDPRNEYCHVVVTESFIPMYYVGQRLYVHLRNILPGR